jgi:hypothetical protein
MLFILTNSQDATASFLTAALNKSEVPFVRLDTDQLVPRIAISYRPRTPAIKVDNIWYEAEQIGTIWYRRPERLKDERFANSAEGKCILGEWTEFIEGFFAHVPKSKWINYPSNNALASHKLEQLTTASTLGFEVPDTLGTQDRDSFREFFTKNQGQVVTKPIASGYLERSGSERDSLIYTNQVHAQHLEDLDDLSTCPTFFQQFIRKQFDVRITVVDGDIHAVALFAKDKNGQQRCDIRRNNMADVAYEKIELPTAVRAAIEKLMNHYGLRFAAIDMAVAVTGEWFFFEINPNQCQPIAPAAAIFGSGFA